VRTAYLLGDHARATSLLKRFVDVSEARQTSSYGHHLLSYVRLALVCGAGDIASVLATPDRVDRTLRGVAQRTATAWLALDAGQLTTAVTEFSAVADRWWAVGNRLEHSYCLVGIATALEAGEDPVAPPARNEAELARSALGLPWPCIAPAARGPDVDRGPGASDDRGGATSSA